MPAIAAVKTSSILTNVGVTSSATVSVDKTFDPEGFKLPGVARWVDRSGGIEVGYPSLDLSVRPPPVRTNGERMYKVTANLRIPTLEVTSPNTMTGIQPAPTLAYACSARVEVMLPARSTLAERTALFSHLKSLFEDTINASDASPTDSTGSPIKAAVLNFDPPY
jgi:hypothetical protein